ncbi:group I intron-associated PD-(D/E)XK endonuclease [Saliphagus sp. GCM10025334]
MGNSKNVGDETEAAILAHLVARGLSVSIPFGDNDPYDLIIDAGEACHRVQCKTAWKNKEHTIRFNTHSQTTRDGDYHEQTYDGKIDAFLVRYPPTETLYWVDIEDATVQEMELRFESKMAHPSINWAEEYELDEQIPLLTP